MYFHKTDRMPVQKTHQILLIKAEINFLTQAYSYTKETVSTDTIKMNQSFYIDVVHD